MSNSVLRRLMSCALALTATATALAQQVDVVAGNGRFVASPAGEVFYRARSIVLRNDGFMYTTDVAGRMLRVDTTQAIATAMPTNSSEANFTIPGALTLALDAGGIPYAASAGTPLWQVFPEAGQTQPLSGVANARDMAFGPDGTLYFVRNDGFVYARDPSGVVRTIAGNINGQTPGDGGPALAARLSDVWSVAHGPGNSVYLAERLSHRVRRISLADGIITTVAGTGAPVYNGDGLPALQTNVDRPSDVAFDGAGNLYISIPNRVIRIDAISGLASTFVNGNSSIPNADELTFDAVGNLFFIVNALGGDPGLVLRRDAVTGQITRFLGTQAGGTCGEDMPAREACFGAPFDLEVEPSGSVVVADPQFFRVRRITPSDGRINSIYSENTVGGFALHPSGDIYVVRSTGGNSVMRYHRATGLFTQFAGNGSTGYDGDGRLALSTSFSGLRDVAIDAQGNLYIADTNNNRVRKIDAATNRVSTLTTFTGPTRLDLDGFGNLLVGGTACRLIRVNLATGISTHIAGLANGGCNNTDVAPLNGLATQQPIGSESGFATDSAGNVYIGWGTHLHRIDAASGFIRTVTPPAGGWQKDGIGFTRISRLKFDGDDRLYVLNQNQPYVIRISGIVLDTTPPVIVPHVSGELGDNGWYRSDVQVSWTVTDDESPLDPTGGCPTEWQTSDADPADFMCYARSAGGAAEVSIQVRRDATPPVVEFAAPSPEPNASGWYPVDVAVAFTASDETSGVDAVSEASPLIVGGEGAGLSATVFVTDVAGNTAEAATPPVNIDRTPPQIAIAYPGTGLTFAAYSTTPDAEFTCSDDLSSVADCHGNVTDGYPLPTSPGAHQMTVTALDHAGNEAAASRSYTVAPLLFERFIEPLRRSPTFNGVTAGSLVAIRWRLLSAGQPVTNPEAFDSITVFDQTCQGTAIPLNDTATGGEGLTVNPANGYFTYNWQTDASWAGTCKRVRLHFGDDSTREVVFRF